MATIQGMGDATSGKAPRPRRRLLRCDSQDVVGQSGTSRLGGTGANLCLGMSPVSFIPISTLASSVLPDFAALLRLV